MALSDFRRSPPSTAADQLVEGSDVKSEYLTDGEEEEEEYEEVEEEIDVEEEIEAVEPCYEEEGEEEEEDPEELETFISGGSESIDVPNNYYEVEEDVEEDAEEEDPEEEDPEEEEEEDPEEQEEEDPEEEETVIEGRSESLVVPSNHREDVSQVMGKEEHGKCSGPELPINKKSAFVLESNCNVIERTSSDFKTSDAESTSLVDDSSCPVIRKHQVSSDVCQASQPVRFSDIRYDIPELKDDNYLIWKERVLFNLGWMGFDYAIKKDEPPLITNTSSAEDIALYKGWERSNRLSVMFIKTKLSASIRGFVDHHDKVQNLLKAIDDQFITSKKALASTLIMKFSSLRLTSVKGVREHIMQMSDIAAQLKDLEVDMSEDFLVHYILNTLPHQYGLFKTFYYTLKDKWSISELMTMCVQEEERLVMEEGESITTLSHRQGKSQANKKGKTIQKEKGRIPPQYNIKKDSNCFFCKKKGHMKKECAKYQKWRENKGFAKPK